MCSNCLLCNGGAVPERGMHMYTYCVFCDTSRSRRIAMLAERLYNCRAISPQREQLKWVKKVPVRERHDLLPGYVFLYSEPPIQRPSSLRSIPGVIRCLSDQEHQYVLQGNDEKFALMLLDKEGVIGSVKVFQEGDRIRVCDGMYAGLETRILKINKRNLRMLIEIPFAGMQVKSWVEYVMVRETESTLDT